LASGQTQGARTVGLLEVVDIAPIVGDFYLALLPLARYGPFYVFHDGASAASACEATYEDVVAWTVDAEAKFQGLNGPILPNELLQGRDLIGTAEGETGGIYLQAQLLWGDA